MDPPKISLSFSKKKEKTILCASALSETLSNVPSEDIIFKENISTFDKDTKRKKPTKKELVIPLLESRRESDFQKRMKEAFQEDKYESKDQVEETTNISDKNSMPDSRTMDEIAAEELIRESRNLDVEQSKISEERIELRNSLQNESEENEDAEISNLDDYDRYEIDAFGAALLRGMGWKKGKGIGKSTFKRVVDIIDPTAGQILGQIKKAKNVTADCEDVDEELPLAKNCHIFIRSGRHKGVYGIVESLDCDHLIMKPALGGAAIREVEANVKVISKAEYKNSSRVINKDMYDKFKDISKDKKDLEHSERVPQNGNEVKSSHNKEKFDSNRHIDPDEDKNQIQKCEEIDPVDDYREDKKKIYKDDSKNRQDKYNDKSDDNKYDFKDAPDKYNANKYDSKDMHNKYNNSYNLMSDHKSDKNYSKNETRHSKQKKQSVKDARKSYKNDIDYDMEHHKQSQLSIPVIPWARENLRVRLINKSYKGGAYHKEKVKVQCIDSVHSCTCITDDGKVLYDVDPDWLETVIPKGDQAIVLIVKGQDKGEKARILQLHKEMEKATVQLLQDSSVLLKLHYEDICEYIPR